MERSIKIRHDLESVPLEIKTDAVIGTETDNVDILFYDSQAKYIGQFFFKFSSPRYHIYGCTGGERSFQDEFPDDKPGTPTIIKITKTGTGDATRLGMFYNEVQVLDFLVSTSTCSNQNFYGDVEKIEFYQFDKGLKYYKLPP